MNEESSKTRYLVVVRYASDELSRERVIGSTRGIKELLERMCAGECQLAWTGETGQSFAMLVKTNLRARQIYDGLQSPGQNGPDLLERNRAFGATVQSSPMRRGDDLLILEVGADFHGIGFSRAWTWLQHH